MYFLVDLKTIGCNFRIEENGTKIDFGVCLLWRSKTSENSYLIHCMVTRRFGVSCFPFIFQKKWSLSARMTFRFTFRLKSQISAGKGMADADAPPTWKRPNHKSTNTIDNSNQFSLIWCRAFHYCSITI